MADEEEPPSKRQNRSSNAFLRAWAWKREHRPDKVRFDRPYTHQLRLPGNNNETTLTIHQQRLKHVGFASTVWDSSLVLSKYIEKHAAQFQGLRCLDLSAGCGVPGIVLSKLGAGEVVATDLGPNLPLPRKNCEANGCDILVREHTWGESPQALGMFDVVVACDVMYVIDAIPALLRTLEAVAGPATDVYIAHGRNRQALPAFLDQLGSFTVAEVPGDQLDEIYQCDDVTVLHLRKVTEEGAALESPS